MNVGVPRYSVDHYRALGRAAGRALRKYEPEKLREAANLATYHVALEPSIWRDWALLQYAHGFAEGRYNPEALP